MMKKFIAIFLVIMSLISAVCVGNAEVCIPVGSYAYTCKGDVAVRSSPSSASSSNIIDRVNTGTRVYIKETALFNDSFYKVSVDELTSNGYIRADCLSSRRPNMDTWEHYYGPGNLSRSGGQSTSEQIMNFQRDLDNLWYDIGESGVDGYFGIDTERAVMEFQQDHNLTVDGIAGPVTKELLYRLAHHSN